MLDELIEKAIRQYKEENHGLNVPDDIADTIRWLIKHKAEQDGIKEAERYIGRGLWKDLIAHRERQ